MVSLQTLVWARAYLLFVTFVADRAIERYGHLPSHEDNLWNLVFRQLSFKIVGDRRPERIISLLKYRHEVEMDFCNHDFA